MATTVDVERSQFHLFAIVVWLSRACQATHQLSTPHCQNYGVPSCACSPAFIGDQCELHNCPSLCPPGFEGSHPDCSDIDECATYLDGFCQEGRCTNELGSRSCHCNNGSTGVDCFATTPASVVEVNVTEFALIVGRRDGDEVERFLGVPYAQPPIGSRRFMDPESLNEQSEPIEAFQFRAACWQSPLNGTMLAILEPFKTEMPVQSEDCLYLNVWRKEPQPPKLQPQAVLAYITGGWSQLQDGSIHGDYPADLARSHDIIIVTFSYRVGVFGYFSTGDYEGCPQVMNAGLRDIATALRWIHDHIADFGGNSDQITVMAEGDGATAIALLSLLPEHSRDFSKVIRIDGGLFNPHGIRPLIHEAGVQFANHSGCSNQSCPICCLQEIPAHLLIQAATEYYFDTGLDIAMLPLMPYPFGIDATDPWFGPGIEALFEHSGGKPLIIGHEASPSFWFTYLLDQQGIAVIEHTTLVTLSLVIRHVLPKLGPFFGVVANHREIATVLVRYYAADRGITDYHEAGMAGLTMFLDDFLWYWPMHREFSNQRRMDQFCFVHTYARAHHFPNNFAGNAVSTYTLALRDFWGRAVGTHQFVPTETDHKFRAQLRKYFVNFIKFGDTSSRKGGRRNYTKWATMQKRGRQCLKMDAERSKMVNGVHGAARLIWTKIIPDMNEANPLTLMETLPRILEKVDRLVKQPLIG